MRWIKLGLPLTALLLIGACDDAPQKALPPEVFVVTAEEQPYHPQRNFSARIASKTDVNISAEVSGKLLAIHFREGDEVKAGDPLFDIDPAPFKAALSRAQAELANAKAANSVARKNFSRAKELLDKGFISRSEYDSLEGQVLQTNASVEGAHAAVETAQVDLDYTAIKAPQDGRVGRAVPAVGDVVSPNTGTLTTLVGKEGMEAVFQLPEKLLLSARNKDNPVSLDDIEVAVILPDGSEYAHLGSITYLANRVDPTTGTLEVRSALPNPDDLLRTGLYVQAQVRFKKPLMGLMIPQAAVQVDQVGTYALAVDGSDMVTRKNIETGQRFGENVLVTSGLDAGARIIVRGVQKARPGSLVTVSDYKPATEASSGSAAQ
ncbi:MAG: efflux RND transporter periplasmic adaptor subunit [Alcanivorax nanhaiticus]